MLLHLFFVMLWLWFETNKFSKMFAKAFEIALIRSELSCTVTDLPGSTCQGDVSYHESSLFWTQLPCPPRIQSRGWNYLSYFSGLSILYKSGWIYPQPYFAIFVLLLSHRRRISSSAAASSISPSSSIFGFEFDLARYKDLPDLAHNNRDLPDLNHNSRGLPDLKLNKAQQQQRSPRSQTGKSLSKVHPNIVDSQRAI